MADDADILGAFDAWSDRFAKFVANKGKVPPGKYRAFGYTPPSHRWTSVKLWWRDKKMRIGRAPEGSSPQLQGELAINHDITLTPQKGEGEKLRSDEQTSLMN